MPGFPIRTSSDQRLIDNSPRLNAAFHVLHRLSMPRHPPCALNNEHTTNTTTNSTKGTNPNTAAYRAGVNYTKHKRIKKLHTQTTMPTKSTIIWGCSRPLYSSHTTPQPPTTTTQQTMIASATRQHQDNNAPDTQQCTKYFFKNHTVYITTNCSCLRCVSTRLKNIVGSTTHVHSTNTPTTVGKNNAP